MALMEAVKSPSGSRDPLVDEKEISSAQWKDGTSEPVMRGGIGVGACIEMAVVWGSERFLAGIDGQLY
jgi:hypothetical protein